jgi:solute carrier family 25 phosphate transporter 23/24/25/41
VIKKTLKNEGILGFYKGIAPTLAKVVPAVSISYVIYEHTKRLFRIQ